MWSTGSTSKLDCQLYFHSQLLQKLNLMDYSLLVCIHDCTIPPDSDDEDFNDCEEDGYISSDDIGEPPQSPHSPGEMISLHVCRHAVAQLSLKPLGNY